MSIAVLIKVIDLKFNNNLRDKHAFMVENIIEQAVEEKEIGEDLGKFITHMDATLDHNLKATEYKLNDARRQLVAE